MLTRLQVSGFKNLMDVDIRFGPFTCIAGANGVGKSNLFDAIMFLGALAERPLLDAALSVRDESARMGDVRGLFFRTGERYETTMTFAAEMLIPKVGMDDLGQLAEASITFLRYELTLVYQETSNIQGFGALKIEQERLSHINIGDAKAQLGFPHDRVWRQSAIAGRRTSDFISTDGEGASRVVRLHQDGHQGRARQYLTETLPRTVLSASNAAESPTALLARNEMRSWRLLQLEPSALRTPDTFESPAHLQADGAHLPATLYRLAEQSEGVDSASIYAQIANRLAELLGDVRSIQVLRDDQRRSLTLYLKDRSGAVHPANALSDGTLRFLALATLQLDPEAHGVICLEEPENGIHPARIPAMIRLLQDIALDPSFAVDESNPMQQVIVNTHSPEFVRQMRPDDLLIADAAEINYKRHYPLAARFRWLPGTWRAEMDANERNAATVGELLAYLGMPEYDNMSVLGMFAVQPYLWPQSQFEVERESAQ